MEIKDLHQLFLQKKAISTDTRNIIPDSMFFALKGENFDANAFAMDAIDKGASYVVMDNVAFWQDQSQYILVENVLQTLQELASYHRKYLNLPIIGLTGSNGKTTTKELIHIVLSKRYETVATKGNLNNHIGVPLTLLSMREETAMGIVEMGANHFGEIKSLCHIASPDYGYITNFGKAHLEGFGSLEGVVKAKSELYDFLHSNDGIAFVNPNDLNQMSRTKDHKRILLRDVQLVDEDSEFVVVQVDQVVIRTQLVGQYNVANIAAAISIGLHFGINITDIKTAIESFKPDNKRSQLIDQGYCKIILDAYNANPSSMQAALDNFTKGGVSDKVVILGDMFELGESSMSEHQKLVDNIEQFSFHHIFLIGTRFYATQRKTAISFNTFEDFKNHFKKSDFQNQTVLIKGSRGMALERVLELF
ncbi:MAG: UDP-N-acetylmuramoyl-tripeptide--D-alanyl-D-alanine ligase [Flavobacteriaceae bacterium]|nr:UDP-N-acetylmuramoyl-tripeptide--D-alanyl-D-alanine ligase [Flavobacteriaceae bacterium]